MKTLLSTLFAATLAAGQAAAAAPAAGQPPMPLIVTSDALEKRDEQGRLACIIAISANELNGGFVGTVLRWSRAGDSLALELRIAPGVVDWRTGTEEFAEPTAAWIEAGQVSTRDALQRTRQDNPSIIGGRISDAAIAAGLHRAILEGPMRIAVITDPALGPVYYPVEEALPAEAIARASDCMQALIGNDGA
jgi:hypothetical protein